MLRINFLSQNVHTPKKKSKSPIFAWKVKNLEKKLKVPLKKEKTSRKLFNHFLGVLKIIVLLTSFVSIVNFIKGIAGNWIN